MTDESVPNEPRQTTEADQSARSVQVRTTETGGSTAPTTTSSPQPSAEGNSPEPAKRASAPASKAPLITAVEIENFKGIGQAVRIDLRPITLLFGRNSAGKSTVLHALCYAHEILSHRSVDAHTLERGGDQIDLGGFRRFIHGHALERSVRMRFDLNLEDWEVPERLVRKIIEDDPSAVIDDAVGALEDEWIEARAPADFARSGWVTLTVRWDQSVVRPVLDSYEVGVNGLLVGRLERDPEAGVAPTRLAYNLSHPLFDSLRRHGEKSEQCDTVSRQPASPNENDDRTRLAHVVVHNPWLPLPNWKELLDVWGADQINDGEDRSVFEARLSSMLVGIGDTLRNELAAVRYIGPVRRLHPPTAVQVRASDLRGWSDGSEAWDRLLRDDGSAPDAPKLIDGVNDWLTRRDRLDGGYRLQQRSTVELPADDFPLAAIRFLESLPATFRNKNGDLDLDGWRARAAAEIAALTGDDPQQVEARIKECERGEGRGARPEPQSPEPAESRLIELYCKRYRAAAACITYRDNLEQGGAPVRDLLNRIAAAPIRKTLELVTADSGLPVRTSDIGVGISQLLPVIVAALDPDRPGITAIEQPELHAHPKLQVELGDLFAHAADDHRVFLLENHSEHLMLRLLRRIEETHNGELSEGKPELRPDQVSVVYLDQIDGEVQATRLRIDETGEFIDRWPHGFFEERDDELF